MSETDTPLNNGATRASAIYVAGLVGYYASRPRGSRMPADQERAPPEQEGCCQLATDGA